MTAASASFEPDPANVGAARRYAVEQVRSSAAGHLLDDVRTIVSELATNAVLHARTPFTVSLRVDAAGVRIAVTDASPARPRQPRRSAVPGTTGRGLRIVEQLSTAWGVEVHGDTKTTWCVLPVTAPTGQAVHPGSRARAPSAGTRPAGDDPVVPARPRTSAPTSTGPRRADLRMACG